MGIVYIWYTITISVFYFLSGSIEKKLKAVKAGIVEASTQTWGVNGGELEHPFSTQLNPFYVRNIFSEDYAAVFTSNL